MVQIWPYRNGPVKQQKIKMNAPILQILTSNFLESETQAIESLILEIENLKIQSESLSPEEWQNGLQRLSPYRLRSSGSLKSGKLQGWVKANSYVSQKVLQEKKPTRDDILNINALMRETPEEASIRTTDIFIGPHKACAPEQLPFFLAYFYENILPTEKHPHPLLAAALCRYWLVSLHPFKDGNGRTSVMICDWLLLSSNYLPLSLERQLDALIATFQDGRTHATPAQAVIKSLKSALHSYQVVLNTKMSTE